MSLRFWVEGRLSWPIVLAIVLLAAWLQAVDYIWRVFVMPGSALIGLGIGGVAIIAALLFFLSMRAPAKGR